MIPFNKIYTSGKEFEYIKDTIDSNKIGGDGKYADLCEKFFEKKYSFDKCLMTTSCTSALEISFLLMNLQPGDEVIMPSFTFVSTANAVMLNNGFPVFADSMKNSPNIDADKIESLITGRTKAVTVVHYAGISCDMKKIKNIADKHDLILIEDAAHSIDSYFCDKPLGSLGHLSAFSFHETKNITSGEGGMLVVNDDKFSERAEIIREKGTNRSKYLRGEINKYEWVDIGSSYIASEMNMAFLYAQLNELALIQKMRVDVWNEYYEKLKTLEDKNIIHLPFIPDYAVNNGHIFYLICGSSGERDGLINYLKNNDISSAFHYLSLHRSPYFRDKYQGDELKNSDRFSECLLRLPLYCGLKPEEITFITDKIKEFYGC